ncbi:MAG: hypothetical protein D6737_17745, partial [Chloroflexi bacterium]
EIPLWNPHQFAGIPFLAAGQQSTLYPFSILYYVLPLPAAYGWFTVVQLWLAGVFMYAFVRGLGVRRAGALVAGVTYQLSAFFLISVVFPMIIAAAVWLPLLLLMIEFIIREQAALRGRRTAIPWIAIGAMALGMNILAGHVEITYYTLIIMAYYAVFRLGYEYFMSAKLTPPPGPLPVHGEGEQSPAATRDTHHEQNKPLLRLRDEDEADGLRRMKEKVERTSLRKLIARGLQLTAMVALGIGLGAAQFVPLFELASNNFRDGAATFEQVRGWAHPARDVVQFVLPNFYGNPAHHEVFDVFAWQSVPVTTNALGHNIRDTDWGIKNYVEGALYVGILPLLLAGYALLDAFVLRRGAVTPPPNPLPASREGELSRLDDKPPYHAIFAVLALAALTFMFGMVTYGVLFFTLPGIDQLHSPFRWVFAATFSVAVLAGFGVEALSLPRNIVGAQRAAPLQTIRRIGYGLIAVAILVLGGLVASRIFYTRFEPLIERIFNGMAKAPEAFADTRMFYSYEFRNVLIFGVMLLGAGVVFWLAGRSQNNIVGAQHAVPLHRRAYLWQALAVILIVVDLMLASWGFNPASDPALLDFTPPAVEWMQGQPGDFRFTTLDDPTKRALMQANLGWQFGLDDVRGYESIIPKQYVDYMQQLAPQIQLDFNRVAPVYTAYHESYNFTFTQALDSPLLDLLNVRYVMTHNFTMLEDWPLVYEDEAVRIWENVDAVPRAYVVPAADFDADSLTVPATLLPGNITRDTGREQFVDVAIDGESWLVMSQTYFPGWRAFIRPMGADEREERPLDVQLVKGNFQGVLLTDAGEWTVRFVYSPTSFQAGLFASFISVVLIIFMVGTWLWRLFIVTEEASGVSVIARNSIAPIILNLFNRFIDFAFAFVMLRILGPEEAGIYYYAIIVFGWFDIFTNFGLNIFLTREVARDKAKAARYFFNTSLLRLILAGVGVPLLIAFLAARQATIDPPLTTRALLAIALLYIGLIPNSLSTGMSALFYAFEKAEYPAGIATVATISKTTFGLAALLLGYGVVGLAAVSIITNLITFSVMVYGGRELLRGDAGRRGDPPGRPYKMNRNLIRGMVGESWPLMLNHFLAQIFFQIDVVIIEALHGARMVGQYSVAYKWVLALNIVPAFFTQAMLPVMSRQAHENPETLKRNYQLAIKLLVSTATPTAVLFTFLARPLTFVLGGSEFLPEGAIALQLMIWSIPIGWMNSLTQYVLIALDLQRRITRAFFIGVTFNIVTNLIFVPQFGFRAAAITTIASEIVLLVPFAWLLQGALGRINWFELVWRPFAASGVMAAVLWVGWDTQPLLALFLALLIYPVVLLALRPLN